MIVIPWRLRRYNLGVSNKDRNTIIYYDNIPNIPIGVYVLYRGYCIF